MNESGLSWNVLELGDRLSQNGLSASGVRELIHGLSGAGARLAERRPPRPNTARDSLSKAEIRVRSVLCLRLCGALRDPNRPKLASFLAISIVQSPGPVSMLFKIQRKFQRQAGPRL